MANEEHLKIVKQGGLAGIKWHKAHREVKLDLRDANLHGAHLFVGPLLKGADLTHAKLGHAVIDHADLSGADLRGAMLNGASLNDSNLSNAYFLSAKLQDTKLIGTNLSGANFSVADLSGADLHGAILTRTKLYDADLRRANLGNANLAETNFRGAKAGFTIFTDVDLSTAKEIETIKHHGPSTIDINTIYRSRGKIPAEFLRGAGVPDNFIEYMSSLVGTAFEFYSCFISYSGKDQEFANRLFADLQREGVRCWFAPHHVQAGKKLHEQIDVAIRLHERLLLILSPESINSEWVKTEIAKASKRETQEGKRVLFPIRLNLPFAKLSDWEFFDPFIGKDLAREIAEYYIPDFTRWKDHDQYKDEFKKLLRDLKKGDASAAGA